MPSLEDQIRAIEEEIRTTASNKATQTHIGRLKARLAFLRLERETRARGKGGGVGYAVRKSGHATVGLVGYPSVGKSTLLTRLTGAQSEAGAYDFTTVSIIPGMLRYSGASIQVLDMPGLVPGASRGRGRGREVLSVVRSCDLILFLIDPEHADIRGLVTELESGGVRINQRPPRIVVTRADRGGLTVSSTVRQGRLSPELATDIAREFGLHNGEIVLRQDASAEELIDVIAGNRVYVAAILAINKADQLDSRGREELRRRARPFSPVFVSARTGDGVAELIRAIAQALSFIRVYVKPPGREADLAEPVILRQGARVAELLERLPTELRKAFKAAMVWGPSARFPGQTVGKEHRLSDEDIVTVVIQRGARATA